MVNASTNVRFSTFHRSLGVMALTTVHPDEPWIATACKGGPGKAESTKDRKSKVVAQAYGKTEEEAMANLKASLKEA